MKAKLFEFFITDFEEVYTVIDDENKRLHISPINYSFNITLDLTKDLTLQIEQQTRYGEMGFNKKVRQVAEEIIKDLKLH
ncbi:hypothetical protein [Lederbergia lenta]|uniref:hypothetical protein n=1 Tax=Lederbergia lenta TaxID=1467 RepID=UPI00203B1997|nr:hypothetical protein [Lederbergia lenta]MCM3113632.1 hypothetical protein [Lederbergia lenta]